MKSHVVCEHDTCSYSYMLEDCAFVYFVAVAEVTHHTLPNAIISLSIGVVVNSIK